MGFLDWLRKVLDGPGPPPVVPRPAAASGLDPDRRAAFLRAHNRARAAANVSPPYLWDTRLESEARWIAEDNARLGRLGHVGSDGSDPWVRINRSGYVFARASENLAQWPDGFPGLSETHQQPSIVQSGLLKTTYVSGWVSAWTAEGRVVSGYAPHPSAGKAHAPGTPVPAGRIEWAVPLWLGSKVGHRENVLGPFHHVGGWLAHGPAGTFVAACYGRPVA